MIDYSDYQNPWKTLFLGMLSPHASKYHTFMMNTIQNIKNLKEAELTMKKKKTNEMNKDENSSDIKTSESAGLKLNM